MIVEFLRGASVLLMLVAVFWRWHNPPPRRGKPPAKPGWRAGRASSSTRAPPPPPGMKRATVIATVNEADELTRAEHWVAIHTAALRFVRNGGGCGCCVVMWDVEGPRAVVDTLPPELSCDSSFVRGEG